MIPHLSTIVADWILTKYGYEVTMHYNDKYDYYHTNCYKGIRHEVMHIDNDKIYLFDRSGHDAYLIVHASNPFMFKLIEECIDKHWKDVFVSNK